jgi:hypothetical protein
LATDTEAVIAAGAVTVPEAVAIQPLASVAVTEYISSSINPIVGKG